MAVLFPSRLLRAKRTSSGRGKSVENDPERSSRPWWFADATREKVITSQ